MVKILKEYYPPKKTKTVKLFKPIYEFDVDKYTVDNEDEQHSDKKYFQSDDKIIGWMEMKVEVDK